MSVRVAPLTEGDLGGALPLFAGYQRFYGVERPDDERNLAFFRRFVQPSEDGLLLGAWDEDHLIGFACLYWTFSSVHSSPIALMNDLFVAEGRRGVGAGRALIESAREAARARGCHHLEWFTAVDNHGAQALYDRLGAGGTAWLAYEIPLREGGG